MRVIVMGAGIAGLNLMHELRRRGITDVTVLDKVHQFEHIGAGIHIGTWGLTVLDANGAGEAVRASGYPYRARRYLDRHGTTVGLVDLEDRARRYGGVTGALLHRADLHQALLQGLPTEQIKTDVHVTDIENDVDCVRVGTRNDGVFEADVLIGCDGLHSHVRESVFAGTPHPLGKRVVRTIIPNHAGVTEFEVYRGIGSSVGITPLPNDEAYMWFNFNAHPSDRNVIHDHGITALRELMSTYTAPHVQACLDGIKDPSHLLVTDLHEVTVDPWYLNRVVLCGDAAHAMSPSTGSGGTMAIEDGFVLARELGRADAGEIPLEVALDNYYSQRLPRVEGTRARTRLASHDNNLATEELCRRRDERDRIAMADPDYHAFEVTDALTDLD